MNNNCGVCLVISVHRLTRYLEVMENNDEPPTKTPDIVIEDVTAMEESDVPYEDKWWIEEVVITESDAGVVGEKQHIALRNSHKTILLLCS